MRLPSHPTRQNDQHAKAQAVTASSAATVLVNRGNHQGTTARIASTAPTTAFCERALRLISSDGEPCDDKRKLAILGKLAAENEVKDIGICHVEERLKRLSLWQRHFVIVAI
jgi:hypothetical protein